MDPFENLVITNIQHPFVVHSEKGRQVQMKNRHYFGLSLCISGQIIYTMNGKKYISNQNNAIILPQGGCYSLCGDKEGMFPVINFSCNGFKCTEILEVPLQNPQACIQLFKTLQQLFLHKKSHLKIYSAFYDLLTQIASSKEQNIDLLDFVVKFIEDNIQDPLLSNVMLAKQVSISEVYLRKLFLAHYHITPKQYILNYRIDKAKQLLINSPFTVTFIAQECGFSSVYHFCRAFKKRTGLSPTEYIAENKIYQI